METVNQKKLFLWNMLGTISASLVSVVLLLLASRFSSSTDSDLFSIAFALGQQFYVLGYFQVRNLQATDVHERYSFTSYHNTRLITVLLMLFSAFIYILFEGDTLYKATVILLLVIYRAIDAYSDVFQGLFQQKSRSDLAGKIQFYRSWICMFAFGIALFVTHSLLLSSVVICLLNLILTFPLDFSYLKRYFNKDSYSLSIVKDRKTILSILRESFPLFLNGFLLTYIYNEPKLAIDELLEKGSLVAGSQRDFNILFMPVFVLSLLFFVLRPLITQLSIYWHEKQFGLFYKQIRKLILVMSGLGVIIVGLGYLLGTEILGFVYGLNLTNYRVPFTILLVAGIFNVLVLVIDIVMTIFGRQKYLVVAYIVTFAVSKLISSTFIEKAQLYGAALSFFIAMTVFLITSSLIYWYNKKQIMKEV